MVASEEDLQKRFNRLECGDRFNVTHIRVRDEKLFVGEMAMSRDG